MPGRSTHSTPAPGGTSHTDSTPRVVSSLASGIACNLTPLRGFENLSTHIPNPDAHGTITNPLRMRATEKNQRQRQCQFQPQVVSTPQSVVSRSRSIHRFGQSDTMRLVFTTGRLMELYMWNRWPFMSTSGLQMVRYVTQHAVKVVADAPHWQIIEKYRNTAMQQNNIWSIAFEVCTKNIVKEVC
jgi:hypothetical protein